MTNETDRPESPHETTSPSSSAIDAQFGPRAPDPAAFAGAIDLHGEIDESEIDQVFRCSGGRVRIAQVLIDAAARAGVPAADIDSAQIGALMPAELTPRITVGDRPSGALYLLMLFSTAPRATSAVVELIHAAYRAAELEVVEAETSEALAARLVTAGLLVVEVGGDSQFTVPPLIRALANRAAAQWTRELGRSPREAFGIAIADRYGRTKAEDESGIQAIIDLVVAIDDWDLLEKHWTRSSLNAFDDLSAVEIYLHVPESVVARRPILALARSAARRVDSMRRRLDTDDRTRLLPATDFTSIVIPGLRRQATANRTEATGGTEGSHAVDTGVFTPEDEAILITMEAREHRLGGDYAFALKTIEAGRRRLRERDENDTFGISQMFQAELNLETGRNLVSVGRFSEAIAMLERVVQFSEIYAPNSWHPVLAAHVEISMASLGRGLGEEIDRHLHAARERMRSLGLGSLPSDHKALCIDVMRRLDELDLVGAQQALARLRQNGSTQGLGALPLVLESLEKVYEGRASIAAKMLVERANPQQAPLAGASKARYSGMTNIASFVFFAAGETKAIQELTAGISLSDPGLSLINARQCFVFSQREQLWAHTGRIFATGDSPRLKGSAAALRAAFLIRGGRDAEARDAFGHVLDYCAIASSLMPIAQLPKQSRAALITATATHPAWAALAGTFGDSEVTAEVVQQRLRDLPETMTVSAGRQVDLSGAELSLLIAIDSPKSLAQIAKDFGVVIGTLKNRLSALYKKLGVRSRAQAVEYGNRNGYLSAGENPDDWVG